MKEFLENDIYQAIKTRFFLLSKLSEEKLSTFESLYGKQCSGNPRAVFEYIRGNCPEYQCTRTVKEGYEVPFVEENASSVKWLS